MNDKDFSELLACFREAGQTKGGSKKPDGVCEIDPPAGKPVRTKLPLAQDPADAASAKASGKKTAPLKDVKKSLDL